MNHLVFLLVVVFTTFQFAGALGEEFSAGNARVLRFPPQSRGVLGRAPGASFNYLSGAAKGQLLKARDTCSDGDDSVCADIMVGGNIVQQIHVTDNGCTALNDAGSITGINVYNCWCGLWSASDSGACNNGDDTVVGEYNACAGMQTSDGWQATPNFISCYRSS